MPATIYRGNELSPEPLRGARIAVLGYGSQGRAHTLNLRDAGLDVVVGLRKGSQSAQAAAADCSQVETIEEACIGADLVAMLLPDQAQATVFEDFVSPNLQPGVALLFAHGFNIRFGEIDPRSDIDVVLVAPKAPGPTVRSSFEQGGGVPALGTRGPKVIDERVKRSMETVLSDIIDGTFAREDERERSGSFSATGCAAKRWAQQLASGRQSPAADDELSGSLRGGVGRKCPPTQALLT